ncbi:lipopolysaccharide transport periplasmic protein LptA [Acinetobacter sp. ANC 3882]|uniref:lipopolysaccharide transport periplasmic protein LptA n=1 Tax=Acinetobacter sp. ANC 3882 TaxID=2923423 RepID=UPI001F4AC1CE|nr:lipopolysaccharide transport periplasmic protein LptA [Acinetobacter sp. ANC 3882]MCH7313342.1 lipopolysaccharide transport periplasmic protein LptA [Acinetobacter sp. ANC 3882]
MMKKILSITSILMCSTHVYAIESDFQQSIHIAAENTLFSPNQNSFSASNIQIKQGTIDIQAAKAIGTLKNGQPDQLTLTGSPVRFQQKVSEEKGMVYGKANRVDYSTSATEIVLKGNASIIMDGSSISGETLRYNLTVGDVEARGSSNKRVQIVIPPQKKVEMKPLKTSR